jgi:hypothetical protein
MAHDLHAGDRRADAEAAILSADLPHLRYFLDVDQEGGLDQVGFHLHDHIGAAGQYTRRPGRAGQQCHCSLQRCRRLIPEIRHQTPVLGVLVGPIMSGIWGQAKTHDEPGICPELVPLRL